VPQLSSIREKITWQLVVAVLLYLAAAAALAAVFLPLRLQTERLADELERLAQSEQQLMRLLEQRSSLEARLRELQNNLSVYAELVPSQYDLNAVLEGMGALADQYNLTLESTTTSPVAVQEGGRIGSVPLSMELVGGSAVPSYLAHLQEAFPSLRLLEAAIDYAGEGWFRLSLRGDLQVVLLEQPADSSFALHSWQSRVALELQPERFGLPFQYIARFLQGQVQLLGIVNSGSQQAALISQGGVGRWLRVGDRLEGPVVRNIAEGTVWLDLDGVQLKLTMGS